MLFSNRWCHAVSSRSIKNKVNMYKQLKRIIFVVTKKDYYVKAGRRLGKAKKEKHLSFKKR